MILEGPSFTLALIPFALAPLYDHPWNCACTVSDSSESSTTLSVGASDVNS